MNLIPRIKAESISPIKNHSKTQQNWFQINRNNFFLGNPYPTYTLKQKEFTRPRPEREYRRFPETKKALSGMDPSGKIQEFINKDIIRPLSRPSLYDHFNIKLPNYKHNDLYKTKPNDNSNGQLIQCVVLLILKLCPKFNHIKHIIFLLNITIKILRNIELIL